MMIIIINNNNNNQSFNSSIKIYFPNRLKKILNKTIENFIFIIFFCILKNLFSK